MQCSVESSRERARENILTGAYLIYPVALIASFRSLYTRRVYIDLPILTIFPYLCIKANALFASYFSLRDPLKFIPSRIFESAILALSSPRFHHRDDNARSISRPAVSPFLFSATTRATPLHRQTKHLAAGRRRKRTTGAHRCVRTQYRTARRKRRKSAGMAGKDARVGERRKKPRLERPGRLFRWRQMLALLRVVRSLSAKKCLLPPFAPPPTLLPLSKSPGGRGLIYRRLLARLLDSRVAIPRLSRMYSRDSANNRSLQIARNYV